MIIVNQERDSIINTDNVQVIELLYKNIFVVYDFDNGACQKIGYYDSEKRAKKVFEEIVEKFEKNEKKYYMPKK